MGTGVTALLSGGQHLMCSCDPGLTPNGRTPVSSLEYSRGGHVQEEDATGWKNCLVQGEPQNTMAGGRGATPRANRQTERSKCTSEWKPDSAGARGGDRVGPSVSSSDTTSVGHTSRFTPTFNITFMKAKCTGLNNSPEALGEKQWLPALLPRACVSGLMASALL